MWCSLWTDCQTKKITKFLNRFSLLLNLFYSSLRIPEKNCFLMIVWSSFECFSPLDFPPKEEYISARRVLLYSILATSCTMDQWIITLYCMYKQHKNHFIQKYLKVTRWKQKERKRSILISDYQAFTKNKLLFVIQPTNSK